jgi:hypothetical protein
LGKKNLLMGGKKEKKRKKKENRAKKVRTNSSAASACGWPVFELPLFGVRCHSAASGLHRGVQLPRRTAER